MALALPAVAAPSSETAVSQPAGWVETGRFYYKAECENAGGSTGLPPRSWKCEQGPNYRGLWELR